MGNADKNFGFSDYARINNLGHYIIDRLGKKGEQNFSDISVKASLQLYVAIR